MKRFDVSRFGQGWFVVLMTISVAAGLAARDLLTVWPSAGGLPPWPQSSAREYADLSVTCNALAWPFAMAAGAAFLWRGHGRWSLGLLELHLAIFVICLVVRSPFYGPDAFDTLLVFITLGPETLLYVACLIQHRPRMGWIAPALAAAVVVGASVGVHAWSEALPARIVAAAELASAGETHCIVVGQRRATKARHLTGGALMPLVAEFRDFHALLVIGLGEMRRVLNWSFRVGAFLPVSTEAMQRMAIYPRRMAEMDWCSLPPPFTAAVPPYQPRPMPAPQRIAPRLN